MNYVGNPISDYNPDFRFLDTYDVPQNSISRSNDYIEYDPDTDVDVSLGIRQRPTTIDLTQSYWLFFW